MFQAESNIPKLQNVAKLNPQQGLILTPILIKVSLVIEELLSGSLPWEILKDVRYLKDVIIMWVMKYD